MKLAKVTGTITATVKEGRLVGSKLLMIDMIDVEGTTLALGDIAVDCMGAGVGDTVLVASGSAARMADGQSTLPIDLSIIAIVDGVRTS
jgi:ethanolamine utilization protein EutN